MRRLPWVGALLFVGLGMVGHADAMVIQVCTTRTGTVSAEGVVGVTTGLVCTYSGAPESDTPAEPGGGGSIGDAPGKTDSRLAEKIQTEEEDPCKMKQQTTSQPVVIATGNKIKPETDFVVGKDALSFGLLRLYDKGVTKYGIFGYRWTSSLEYTLTFVYGSAICIGKMSGATSCSHGSLALTRRIQL